MQEQTESTETMQPDEVLRQMRWARFYVISGVYHQRNCATLWHGDFSKCDCGETHKVIARRAEELKVVNQFDQKVHNSVDCLYKWYTGEVPITPELIRKQRLARRIIRFPLPRGKAS